ncbi:VWA domain-containing protein [Paenibacillus chartarius]|uniref:VWA domain-containing protein n=1 Tax=Paenibacillus chartarius TaxID=747481 RepID=A0ABV6DTZ5_9BACL
MKQIIVITDGCSNVGVSPVIAAAHAKAEGITVNVIGVIDRGELGVLGTEEIREIAEAGGGMSRIVQPAQLAQTVQMMTRKTVAHTIQQAVNKELQQILGEGGELGMLPPDKRAQVVHVIDELSETSELDIALLVDASASMKPKLNAVREAIRDLMLSLKSRTGESRVAVFHFPGTASGSEIEMDTGWTTNLAQIAKMFYKINMRGTTPTGPAMQHVIGYMTGQVQQAGYESEQGGLHAIAAKDGYLSDYVV